jgi:hypothetical protein
MKRANKKFYCIICGDAICEDTWYCGKKRCKNCYHDSQRGVKRPSHSKKMQGKNNPMFGKSRPKKVRNKISNTTLKNKSHSGIKNGMFGIRLTGKLNGMFGKCHTDETKEKIRKTKIGKKVPTNTGKNCHLYGQMPEHTKRIKYNNIKMRSSWEAKYAQYLDGKNIKWLYEPKAFELIINKKETTYTPDFYLPEFDCYIEIKGWWRDDAKKKFKKFKQRYNKIKIKVLGIQELKKLKIL